MSFVILLAVTFILGLVIRYLFNKPLAENKQPQSNPDISIKSDPVRSEPEKTQATTEAEEVEDEDTICVVYGSQKGTAKRYATQLVEEFKKQNIKCYLYCASKFDPDELLMNHAAFVFIVSTYTDGKPTKTTEAFYSWLEDTSTDFRVPKNLYAKARYAIYGCGNSQYAENFNTVARAIDSFFRKLSLRHIIPIGMGDVDSEEMEYQFETWTKSLIRVTKRIIQQRQKKRKGKKKEQIRTHLAQEESVSQEEEESGEMVEIEDVGKMITGNGSLHSEYMSDEESSAAEVQAHTKSELMKLTKPMLSNVTRKSLEHQGYKIIGSHSGVKLCRWTKSQLRGRGGCYKHTFYGITSYQCMEMTPSLACANKCVFCWRHHTNPVGKNWKWKVDEPEVLIEGAMSNHIKMIKSLKGVPGIIEERYIAAQNIQHCALSLVGEPIMYPFINEFIDLLHEKRISSFLVTNAQFPDKMEDLRPCTQLYLSIDAATKESLKKIDRPLFPDYWERFLSSIMFLKKKGQRTVFRLTLVKSYNMEEIVNYSELINMGLPDFIEVKGVTYCGDSGASDLTIKNTPFHEEVVDFCKALCKGANSIITENVEYEIACEHKHSLCVLIANKTKFYREGQWHTWIDYDKFHQLIAEGKHFQSEDYLAPTPSWAVSGSPEEGFSPNETRFKRLKQNGPTQGC